MRKELKFLNFASAFSGLAAGLFGPFYAVFIDNIGGGAFVAGNSYSVFAVAAGILVFFISRWEERHENMEKLVFAGYLILTISYFSYYFVETVTQMFMVQALVGVGTATVSPAFDELYSKNISGGNFAQGWGFWESMSWIVTGISASVGGYIVAEYGFRNLFLAMGVFELTATIVIAILVLTD